MWVGPRGGLESAFRGRRGGWGGAGVRARLARVGGYAGMQGQTWLWFGWLWRGSGGCMVRGRGGWGAKGNCSAAKQLELVAGETQGKRLETD